MNDESSEPVIFVESTTKDTCLECFEPIEYWLHLRMWVHAHTWERQCYPEAVATPTKRQHTHSKDPKNKVTPLFP